MQCFSCMLISNVHKSIIVSIDTRFSRDVFEAIQKTCSTFYWVYNHLAAPCGFKPDKTLLIVFKYIIINVN